MKNIIKASPSFKVSFGLLHLNLNLSHWAWLITYHFSAIPKTPSVFFLLVWISQKWLVGKILLWKQGIRLWLCWAWFCFDSLFFASFESCCIAYKVFGLSQDQKENGGCKEKCQQDANDAVGLLFRKDSNKFSIADEIFIKAEHAQMAKDNKNGSNLNHPQKGIKLSYVPNSDAIVDPRTMMVIPVNTSATDKAMELIFLLVSALGTKG